MSAIAQTGRSACESKVDDADTQIALTVATIAMTVATIVMIVAGHVLGSHGTKYIQTCTQYRVIKKECNRVNGTEYM